MTTEHRKSTLLFAAILFASIFMLSGATAWAQDTDGDGAMDAVDPCPHVAFAAPQLAAGYKAILKYGASGPGFNDDAVYVRKFWITTASGLNPIGGDNVHLTLRNTISGATIYAVDFIPANWAQPNPLKKKWVYTDRTGAANGARKALLKEPTAVTPPGSNFYKFRLSPAKDTNIPGPLMIGDGVLAIVEVQSGFAGICFAASADTCTYGPAKDVCLP
jgi:hypothetical protein